MAKKFNIVPAQRIEKRIIFIRGQKIMLDADLAEIYGVFTKAFNQAVKRNIERFPPDFMFRLTDEEKIEVVTNCDHLARLKFSPVLPYAFTEHGAIMAANILNSKRAVEASMYVVRAFIRLREVLDLPQKNDKQ
ncbi:MAG: ORF6N domain-containing protein [Planctomycetota bacterium]